MMPLRFPLDFWRAVLKPIRESHVAVREINGVGSSLRCHGVLLRENKAHDFAELYVVEEELNMDGVWLVIRRSIRFIVIKVVGRDHLHIRVLDVDADRAA